MLFPWLPFSSLRLRTAAASDGTAAATLDAEGTLRARHANLFALGVLVFAGYYLGTRLGLALTFMPNPISVLWPPNAILFAALLLTPPSKWWVVIAAALPAHLVAELQGGVPLTMVLCWFVSNSCEALIGAVVARWLAGGDIAFDRRRDLIAFLAAAVTATLLSSFLDSAFVVLNRWGGRGYWHLWETRVFSNITAALIMVPLIVTLLGGRLSSLALRSRVRRIEGITVVTGLLAATLLVFDVPGILPANPLFVYLPLPFLLWAALRFGPVGTALSIAIVAVLVIWGTGHGIGIAASGSPIQEARSVQLFVMFVAPTLLFVAAVLEERRQAEEDLRMSQSRFHLMLEATKDSVYDREMASGLLWWSGHSLQPLGYERHERPATFGAYLAMIHPEDRQRVLDELARAIGAASKRWQAEYRLRARDGSYAHVREQGFIVRDARGAPAQMIAALSDMTERHDMAELGQRLAHASRLTAMGELTASIAHEINQPMSAILSNVDAAEMLLDEGKYREEDLRDILDDIRADNVRASEIIRHIRGLARKRETEFEQFSIRDLIEGVLRLVAPIAQRRGARLAAAFDGPSVVYADRIHVQQVLLNLLFNAMDAIDEAPDHRRTIRLATTSRADGLLEVSVRDQGHGIPGEQLETIFDSFFTTKKDGMGLGLSIARSLVDAHGGRIWATNNADAGATLHFTLATVPRATRASIVSGTA